MIPVNLVVTDILAIPTGIVLPQPWAVKPAGATPEAVAFIESCESGLFPGAASPIVREIDARVILTGVERLLQSMLEWRRVSEPALDMILPPRPEPEGWWSGGGGGLIQPRPAPEILFADADADADADDFVGYEYLGYDPYFEWSRNQIAGKLG